VGLTTDDVIGLYDTMARMRAVELAQNELWRSGRISGEMHSGVGEEGIVAGVVAHLEADDAIACDHRPTGPFVARGVEPADVLAEMLGHAEGTNHGWGGHMHLMDRDRLLLADGIVGSAGPAACGFALSAQHLRPGSIAVAFFGEGALNQGMLMESFNLARVWRLPVLFVCKDNGWSITTRSRVVSATSPQRRAAGFDLRAAHVSGTDVVAVHRVAGRLVARIRARREPGFLHARCHRPDGHFLGDPMLRVLHDPRGEAHDVAMPLAAAARRSDGGSAGSRVGAVGAVAMRVARAASGQIGHRRADPLARARRRLDAATATAVDERVAAEVADAVERALAGSDPR
jgi:pyruvate dehydrogenase E1 component alpha subunit